MQTYNLCFFSKNYQHCPLFSFLVCQGARDKQLPKQRLATLWHHPKKQKRINILIQKLEPLFFSRQVSKGLLRLS